MSADGAAAGQVITISKPYAGSYSIKTTGLTGTVRIIGVSIFRANYPGVVCHDFARDGIDMNNMVVARPEIIQPIMADLAPDLIFNEFKDGYDNYRDYFDTLRSYFVSAHTPDWIVIRTSPGNDPNNPAIDQYQRATNQYLHGYCAARGLTYWDSYPLFKDGPTAAANGLLADPVHPNAAGYHLMVSAMFADLGLNNLSAATATEEVVQGRVGKHRADHQVIACGIRMRGVQASRPLAAAVGPSLKSG